MNGNGKADLLVSNPLGDVQVLIGNGDGTFQPVQNLDQQVALAVYAPSGNTPAAFIFADQLTDQLVVQTVGGVTTVLGDASTGLISPGAVELADLNNNGILDLIVANSGSNNVLVYPGLGNGTFGPALERRSRLLHRHQPGGHHRRRPHRRRPARPDHRQRGIQRRLHPDQRARWATASPSCQGPGSRPASGRSRPSSRISAGHGLPDLVIADSGSNNVWLLQGLGNGFFNDQSPTIYPVGTDPTAALRRAIHDRLGSRPGDRQLGLQQRDVDFRPGNRLASHRRRSRAAASIPRRPSRCHLPGNGLDSLVVANNGDGNISLLPGR